MGQVFSCIWRRIRLYIWLIGRRNIKADTTTATIPQHDQYVPVEEHGYYIIIPDEEIYMAQPDVITEVVPFIAVNLFNDDRVEHHEKEVVKKVIQVVVTEEVTSHGSATPLNEIGVLGETVRKIGPYSSIQKILLVGEGDFSFSTSLALAFGSASNMTATSLNTQEYLTENYCKFPTNKKELESRGCTVIHGVDATNMIQHSILGNLRFDCIIYNFPHSGSFGKSDAALRKNQDLVRGFVRNAKKMMNEAGEIHITHKSNPVHRRWEIPKLGCEEGLHLTREIRFKLSRYPGYCTKNGFRGNKYFLPYPSKTYVFGLHPKQ